MRQMKSLVWKQRSHLFDASIMLDAVGCDVVQWTERKVHDKLEGRLFTIRGGAIHVLKFNKMTLSDGFVILREQYHYCSCQTGLCK